MAPGRPGAPERGRRSGGGEAWQTRGVRADDVLAVLDRLGAAGVPVWLDGGWSVDALLGRQTRPHGDVDVVLPLDRAALAIAALAGVGFTVA